MSRKALIAAGVAAVLGVGGFGLVQAYAGDTPAHGVSALPLNPQQRAEQLRAAGGAAAQLARTLGLSGKEKLVAKDVLVDTDGTKHLRFDRTYAGIPVVGGDLIIHQAADGTIRSTDWAHAGSINLGSDTPKITMAQARAAAPGLARHGKNAKLNKADLIIYAVGKDVTLAYRATVDGQDATGHLTREDVITDANSGKVIANYELIHDVAGTGKGLLDGTVTLDTTLSGSTYQMIDPVRGNTKIYDSHGASENSPSNGATLYTDSDNVWGNGASSDRASAGVDINYGLAKTWDFYKATFNRSGIRNDGVGATAYAHVGSNLLNAYWQDSCFCMVFGDGNSSNNYTPLSSLDVSGHELTHGVTSNTAGLQYSGESGGLNESTSDIFGTMVEFYANNSNDPGDYYIGEKLNWNIGNAGALRRMDDPTLDGVSKGCWYSGVGNLDVHYSSGIGNHFFYLLSEGSGSKTIGGRSHNGVTCNSSTVAGIGRDKAAAIEYRALTTYMTSTTNYASARTATLNAAKDLYGANSVEYWQVSVAWAAVSVGTALPSPTGTTPPSPSASPSTSPTSSPSPSPSTSTPPAGDVIVNGGFEQGTTGWTGGTWTIMNDGGARTGSYYSHLMGYGYTYSESISQSVTVPSSGTPTLRFYLKVTTQETDGVAYDTLKVQVNGVTKVTYSNLNAGSAYVLRTVDMSAYKGQTVTIKFAGAEDAYLATDFLLDDVALS